MLHSPAFWLQGLLVRARFPEHWDMDTRFGLWMGRCSTPAKWKDPTHAHIPFLSLGAAQESTVRGEVK